MRQAGLMDEGISRLREKGVSEIIRDTLNPFIKELARTFHGYPLDGPGQEIKPVTDFLLCGGGGKLKGLASWLSSEMGIQPIPVNPKGSSHGSNQTIPSAGN